MWRKLGPYAMFISVQVVAILVVELRVKILRHVVHGDERTRNIEDYLLLAISSFVP